MSKFERLTGSGREDYVNDENLVEARECGLPYNRQALARLYRKVLHVGDRYLDYDGNVIGDAVISSRKTGRQSKLTSMSGADSAIAVSEILLGHRSPDTLIIPPSSRSNSSAIGEPSLFNESLIRGLYHVNRPFIVRPGIDDPYSDGFAIVLDATVEKQDSKFTAEKELTSFTINSLRNENVPVDLIRCDETDIALKGCLLAGMIDQYPELEDVMPLNAGVPSDTIALVIAEKGAISGLKYNLGSNF